MSTIEIKTPDGKTINLNAPAGASSEQIRFAAQAAVNSYKKSSSPSMESQVIGKYMTFMGKEGGYGSNPSGKLYSMIQKPFQKLGENLATGIASKFPNIPPQIPAGIGTAVQMVPDIALSFSPTGPGENIKPSAPEGLFRQMESASGGMEGSLSAQFKDPSIMFSKGTSAAKPLYQQAMKEIPYENTIFKGLTDHKAIVDKAVETIENGGKLEPQEALVARKSLDKVKKKMNDDAFNYYRTTLDKIAKSNQNIKMADPMYKRGMMAQSLRQILPQNKYGGTSAFKTTIGALGGPFAAPVLSPAIQGLIAGGMGTAAKTDPRLITAIVSYLRNRRGDGSQSSPVDTEVPGQ